VQNFRAALWRNDGNGHFMEATSAGSFLADQLWCAPIWGDYNRDGFLDLFVANAWEEPPTYHLRNALYFNRADATFGRVTEGDLVNYIGRVFGGCAGDMDDDGDLDLVTTGRSGVALFENDGTGEFRRITAGAPTVTGDPITSSWADYDNDERLDLFVAVFDRTSQLFHNDGDGRWTRMPLGDARQTTCGMWGDYDNDGDLDLFISRGQSPNPATSNLLYANNGDGTFTRVSLGSLSNDLGLSIGCA